ncbi:alternative ribosome rescue aminoacyl-tRNA hydrolase ArfB [Teredinibacter waterburyi]|jgi:Protein chain release factor B|uniref:alternative ribosome rescue aminoacyl-tRNA hydrolase ArfB n=1 Tax=Teredinibacter waterburyi TaxID=1500538 RepID=UPI00165ED5E8|nr:alternative ribosome rescue aminoacyl-tRNA hydrolase ArfB [Teredinibacter waterburyi]
MNSSEQNYNIRAGIYLNPAEFQCSAMRAQGAGGQNVNKVSSAIHLRFDIPNSSLPDHYKRILLALSDSRISSEGVLVIKAQNFRTQEKNRSDAIERLLVLIRQATAPRAPRIATKPSKAAKKRRVEGKVQRGKIKAARGRVRGDD